MAAEIPLFRKLAQQSDCRQRDRAKSYFVIDLSVGHGDGRAVLNARR